MPHTFNKITISYYITSSDAINDINRQFNEFPIDNDNINYGRNGLHNEQELAISLLQKNKIVSDEYINGVIIMYAEPN
jgi:hypothetical protein